MAWFDGILGNGNATAHASSTQPGYISPVVSNTLSHAGSLTTSIANNAIWAGNSPQLSSTSTSYSAQHDIVMKVHLITNYTQAIGWTLTHHHIPLGVTSDDPKISVLKLAAVGDILKDVGLRSSDTDFYVMREPSA